MPLGLNTTALTSPASGTNDGGIGQIAGSLGAIADDAIRINAGIKEARRQRGEYNAQRDFNSASSSAQINSPVDFQEDNSGGLFGASDAAYDNTLSLLALERAKNDSQTMFDELAITTKGNPTEYERLASEQIRGYVEAAPATSRAAIEEELKYKAYKGLMERQKERRKSDIEEANAETAQSITNIGEGLERLMLSEGSAALSSDEYERMLGDYNALQDIRENNPNINYTRPEREADDRALQLRMQAAGYSKELKGIYEEVELAADQDRMAGREESEIITGKQAAYAFIEETLSQVDVTQKERDAMRKSMRADVNAAAQVDAMEVQKFAAAKREQREKVTAEARVAVSRGQLTDTQIDALRHKIGDNNWATLKKENDRFREKQRDDYNNARLYEAVARGDAPFDPYDRKMASAMDKNYVNGLAQKFGQSENPVQANVDYIERTGHFPKALQSSLRTAIMNGDAGDQLVAVEMAQMIRDVSPQSFSKLPKDVREITTAAQSLMNANIPAEDALLRARSALFPESAVKQARKSALTKSVVENGSMEVVNLLQESFGAEAPEEMRIMARTLWHDAYMQLGPDLGMDVVSEMAADNLKRSFGPSRLGRSDRLMKFPPERYEGNSLGVEGYRLPNLSDKENAQWMEEQFRSKVNDLLPLQAEGDPLADLGGDALAEFTEVGYEDNPVARSAFLVTSPDAVRDPQGPSYQIYVDPDNTGLPYPLIVDGELVTYRPNYETSPAALKSAKKAKRKADKEMQSARLGRASLITAEEHRERIAQQGKEAYAKIHKDIYGFAPGSETYESDRTDIP